MIRSSKSSHAANQIGSSSMLEYVAMRYGRALTSFFQRRLRGDSQDCEDLTQEVFLRIARRSELEDIRNLDSYIFQAASGVMLDHLRRRAVRREHASDPTLHVEGEDFSPERVLLGQQEVARLMKAVGGLPERMRTALVLFRFEGLKQSEIAKHMGISVSAVEKHVKAGLLAISAALEDGE